MDNHHMAIAGLIGVMLLVMYGVVSGPRITGMAVSELGSQAEPNIKVLNVEKALTIASVPGKQAVKFSVLIANTGALAANEFVVKLSTGKTENYPSGFQTATIVSYLKPGEQRLIELPADYIQQVQEDIPLVVIADPSNRISESTKEDNIYSA
ncbi:hypothetical protein J4460_07745 [Candidatus Woesearchaeota archaeon]|nr:MAG: hypothetical protein QS99_C0011G0029 [archaeon GW2011_AR4]MBS3130531.1 hypothetical protein [Candidatus Woesearchaeota archaeon]HIH38011.1 hypothetical protein [Candidatus Woesearchaeota archaeon]HIH48680.1 hypothetical protein [Candidatus Woesearchaeota archaeon]HIJ02980.1 hypothetical protein [Candidatus Woesearchaeota archaeon]